MARIARVIAPGIPHHITQRGNRRQHVFFRDADYDFYLDLLAEWSRQADLLVLAYCLMPNHIHLLAIPPNASALTHVMSEVHRRYSKSINSRKGWVGHLWQGRYSSYPLSENHLFNAISYVEQNPVKAGLVTLPSEWIWSSANEREERFDILATRVAFLHGHPYVSKESLLGEDVFEKHFGTGRPLGGIDFLQRLESLTGRQLVPKKAGRKPKKK